MNQRERFLSILVGGLLVSVVVWWGFGKYRSAVKSRSNQITSLQNEQQRLIEQQLQGEYAIRQMGEYMIRSLPGDPERAQSNYQRWLLDMVQAHDLSDADVDFNNSRPIRELYQRLDFSVRGRTDMAGFIDILHAFYAKDYLHRIRSFSLRPNREGDFTIELMIDAIALLSADPKLPPREAIAWKVDGDVDSYRDTILNRNFFEPPNQPPEYTGRSELEAIVGRDTPIPLTFRDPEGHPIRYTLVEVPPEARLDDRSGTLRIRSEEKTEFDIVLQATDQGYPRRSTEQKLSVKVVDPPPPPDPPAPKLAFDDSTQTVLTALVHGRDEWTAWMHVRTRDQTLRLQVGDGFEIGSLKGKVVDVTPRYVMLEIDGRRFTLKPAGNLNEAAKRAEED